MNHKDALEKLCRVCARQVVTRSVKTKHLCTDYTDKLKAVFGVVVPSDKDDTHPQYFCNACKLVLFKAFSTGKPYQHRTVVFRGWCSHTDDSCTVCQHFQTSQRGGRPKKVKNTPGRPPGAALTIFSM